MIEGLTTYFPLGGLRAVVALIEHKLLNNFPDVPVHVPGIAHPVWIRVHTSDYSCLCSIPGMSMFMGLFPSRFLRSSMTWSYLS